MTGTNASNAALNKSGTASAANPSIAVASPGTLFPNFPHIFAKDVGPAGMGLFTSKSLGPGELVLKDTRPLGCVLDTPLLEHRCAWCLTGQTLMHMGAQKNIDLKKCGGCSVVRFCNQVGRFSFFVTRYLLGIRNLNGFLDSFVSCRTGQVLGWAGASSFSKKSKIWSFLCRSRSSSAT